MVPISLREKDIVGNNPQGVSEGEKKKKNLIYLWLKEFISSKLHYVSPLSNAVRTSRPSTSMRSLRFQEDALWGRGITEAFREEGRESL